MGRIPQTIRFEDRTFQNLEALAKKDHTSINSIVNRIIDDYFNQNTSIITGGMRADQIDRIEELEDKVVSLESQINTLNSRMEAFLTKLNTR